MFGQMTIFSHCAVKSLSFQNIEFLVKINVDDPLNPDQQTLAFLQDVLIRELIFLHIGKIDYKAIDYRPVNLDLDQIDVGSFEEYDELGSKVLSDYVVVRGQLTVSPNDRNIPISKMAPKIIVTFFSGLFLDKFELIKQILQNEGGTPCILEECDVNDVLLETTSVMPTSTLTISANTVYEIGSGEEINDSATGFAPESLSLPEDLPVKIAQNLQNLIGVFQINNNFDCPDNQIFDQINAKCQRIALSIEISRIRSIVTRPWNDDYSDLFSRRSMNLKKDFSTEMTSLLGPGMLDINILEVKQASPDKYANRKRKKRSINESLTSILFDMTVGSTDYSMTELNILNNIKSDLDASSPSYSSQLIIFTEIDDLQISENVNQIDEYDGLTNCGSSSKNNQKNTCNLSDQESDNIINSINAITELYSENSVLASEPVPEIVLKSIVNQVETLQKTTSNDLVSNKEEDISEMQENFENLIIMAEPGTKIVSRNSLLVVETMGPEQLEIDPITKQEVFVYRSTFEKELNNGKDESFTSGILAKVPNSIFKNTVTEDCKSLVAFAEQIVPNHLQTDVKDTNLYSSSLVITTCDAVQNQKFNEPVVIEYGVPEKNSKSTNNSFNSFDCVFYDPKFYLWRSSGKAEYNQTSEKFQCHVDHLTYFSLLFKGGQQDNDALTITDEVLTILSIIFCIIILSWKLYFTKIPVAVTWKKLGIKPMERSYLHLTVSLLLVNVLFLFGMDLTTPTFDELRSCLVVGGLGHWTILNLFLVTLETSINLFANLTNSRIVTFYKTWQKIIALLFMPGVAGLVVLINILSLKGEPGYFYGGIFNREKTYLNRRLLSSGKTLCFLHHQSASFHYGLIFFYVFSMLVVISTYIFSAKRILTKSDTDMMEIDRRKKLAKKMIFVFFTIGMTWLFLIFTMVFPGNLAFDWIFVIFKGCQVPVLLFVSIGRQMIVRWRDYKKRVKLVVPRCLLVTDHYRNLRSKISKKRHGDIPEKQESPKSSVCQMTSERERSSSFSQFDGVYRLQSQQLDYQKLDVNPKTKI